MSTYLWFGCVVDSHFTAWVMASKNVPPYGKYGRKNRPSRTKKRKYHKPGSKAVDNTVVLPEEPEEDQDIGMSVDSNSTPPVELFLAAEDDEVDERTFDNSASSARASRSASARKLKHVIPPEAEDVSPPECYVFMNFC